MLYEFNFRADIVVEILSPEAEKGSFSLERKSIELASNVCTKPLIRLLPVYRVKPYTLPA